ncbi:MAG: folylpolyglutamate synthase/dihydrofolate synthase family protein [Candidatus Micrarchaeota archaeon]
MASLSYPQAVSFIESLPSPAEWSLETPRRLYSLLGIDLRCEVLHVAGTNGKGSSCAFASEILRRSGYSVGTYTSPHLRRYNERISVNGRQITDSEFAASVAETADAVKKMRKTDALTPSTFEALTSAALLHFQRRNLDFLVLEAGLGGRLDATNVVNARVALITNAGLEHTAELGPSISAIAREKAGIIKPGARAVTGCVQPSALAQIRAACRKNRASLKELGRDFSFGLQSATLEGTEFDYRGENDYAGLRSSLLGRHQASNASCAIAAVERFRGLGFKIPETAVRAGVLNARWPGRLEVVRRRPLVVLDGAHNPHGARALAAAIRDLLPGRRPVLVLGMLADKDFPRMISILAPLASRIIFCRPESARAAEPALLAAEARKAGCKNVEVVISVAKAVSRGILLAGPAGAVVVAGSLYAVGSARPSFGKGL